MKKIEERNILLMMELQDQIKEEPKEEHTNMEIINEVHPIDERGDERNSGEKESMMNYAKLEEPQYIKSNKPDLEDILDLSETSSMNSFDENKNRACFYMGSASKKMLDFNQNIYNFLDEYEGNTILNHEYFILKEIDMNHMSRIFD